MELTGLSRERHMRWYESTAHWFMILSTLGIWYPVYRHRKNKLARETQFYGLR